MNHSTLIIFVVLILIVVGIVAGWTTPPVGQCTLMACPCDLNPDVSELPCNSCSTEDRVFLTGIVNVIKRIPSREVIVCENGQETGSRFDVSGHTTYEIFLFGFLAASLGSAK